MPPLDEESLAIGKLQGELKGIKDRLASLEKTTTSIDRKLTSVRIKQGTQSGAISAVVTGVILWVKSYF